MNGRRALRSHKKKFKLMKKVVKSMTPIVSTLSIVVHCVHPLIFGLSIQIKVVIMCTHQFLNHLDERMEMEVKQRTLNRVLVGRQPNQNRFVFFSPLFFFLHFVFSLFLYCIHVDFSLLHD